MAGPGIAVEGVEAVVDGDLLATVDCSPGEHLDAMAHGVRITGMIEVAAGRGEHGEPVETELAQVDPVPLGRSLKLVCPQHLGVTPPEDKLTLGEGAASPGPTDRQLSQLTGVSEFDVLPLRVVGFGLPNELKAVVVPRLDWLTEVDKWLAL